MSACQVLWRELLVATLADNPQLSAATVKIGAGGAGGFGHVLPDDPNNTYGFRLLDVGETYSFPFSNVTIPGGVDVDVTPYLVFELESSTDKNYQQVFRSGTGPCVRYGMTRVSDLRTVNAP